MTDEKKKLASDQPKVMDEELTEQVKPQEINNTDIYPAENFDEDELSEEELAELPTISKKIYWLIYALIALIIIGLGLGTYRFFPFFNKIEGVWVSEEYSTYELTAKGDTASFAIKDVQDSNYIDMVFSGNLIRSGSNRYRMKNINVYLEFNKEGVSEEILEAYKSQENLYTVIEDEDDFLKLQYSEEAINSAFSNDLETMFYFTLENFKYELIGQDLRVRSESLSQNSFVMTHAESDE